MTNEKGSDELLAEAGADDAELLAGVDQEAEASDLEEDRVQATTPADNEPGEDYPPPAPPEDADTGGYDPLPD